MSTLPEQAKDAPAAMAEVELSHLDLRYQGHRLQQPRLEEQLLSSIAQGGIQEPLQGVISGLGVILLNGFKRYRCARKLHLLTVPFASWGSRRGDWDFAVTARLSSSRLTPAGTGALSR